jgi:hypothetical protein
MADRYLLESGAPDGYLLEDGTGVLILEVHTGNGEVFIESQLDAIALCEKISTAAKLGGVLVE